MQHWSIRDRNGRPVYMTGERWQHITDRHPELANHRQNVLNTVRYGRRRQDPTNPESYHYYRLCEALPWDFIGIEVIVVFKFSVEGDKTVPNNFVVSAWGIREIA